MKIYLITLAFAALVALAGCDQSPAPGAAETPAPTSKPNATATSPAPANPRFDIYASVDLRADLSHLSPTQKRMVATLIDAATVMDGLFWRQSYGNPEELLTGIPDPAARRFAALNYGPWDRLDGNKPFISGVGPKPLGANFYPVDMSKAEFEAWAEPEKRGLYSLVQRDSAGQLTLVPYSAAYRPELTRAAALLREAADLAQDPDFARYLRLRAEAFLNDDYRASDMAWMEMKNNQVDVVIGPIENYEDRLFNYRTAFEGYVLIKDIAWSRRLARLTQFLPELQRGLPVPDPYKSETPGTDSELNAYDVVFYAGDCNAGAKTIAINLPNDEEVQLEKGTRRLQLKNAMRAKFDKILVPLSTALIAADQRPHITFDAFFANTMFHEVAHGLGIKKTITGGESVRKALKETSAALEEGKADVLGLYMVTELFNKGELDDGALMDNYVTFMASIFRSIRFGAASAHGQANMIRFNFFAQAGAFSRDPVSGHYRINFDKMQAAMADLSRIILTIQGDGDYAKAKQLLQEQGVIGPQLQADLDLLAARGIPVDVSFNQGKALLGL
ncbi:Zn-dependent hydrolase [Exilibacterium tricleocarpae]|uniref:Zn-dependent hydrolase n=1 Tax=Exilibacterium tricleocarpae TaxID=2591008 RepID=A0A545U3H3_9GAMM|nr:Zn-dependent hydrolase [Exilibacterium tricleocarpae]TQV84021.1 Zn-dependent hydrolase [Exilibacterium tricleocarpae]